MDSPVSDTVHRDLAPPDVTRRSAADAPVTSARRSRLWTRGMLWAAAVATVLAAWMIGASEWTFHRARQSLDNLGERAEARASIQLVMRRLLDAETAKRGFLLTGNADYLRPMADAHADIDRALGWLGGHYDREPELARQTAVVARLTRERLSEIDETLALFRGGREGAWRAILDSGIGREKMEQQRAAATALLDAENSFVRAERADVYRTLGVGRYGVLVSALLALLWAIYVMRSNLQAARLQRQHEHLLRDERDKLERQVAQRTAELAELTRYLQELRDTERASVARTLHDDLGARLTAVKLDLTRLRRALHDAPAATRERLDQVTSTLDEVIGLKRRMREGLMPAALQNLGLQPALEMLVAEVMQRSGLRIVLEMQAAEPRPASRMLAYRIVEEALGNVQQHAQASVVRVTLRQADTYLELTVTDDGQGFDVEALRRNATRHGLRALLHRVESVGGRFTIDSAPGSTAVRATLPWP